MKIYASLLVVENRRVLFAFFFNFIWKVPLTPLIVCLKQFNSHLTDVSCLLSVYYLLDIINILHACNQQKCRFPVIFSRVFEIIFKSGNDDKVVGFLCLQKCTFFYISFAACVGKFFLPIPVLLYKVNSIFSTLALTGGNSYSSLFLMKVPFKK